MISNILFTGQTVDGKTVSGLLADVNLDFCTIKRKNRPLRDDISSDEDYQVLSDTVREFKADELYFKIIPSPPEKYVKKNQKIKLDGKGAVIPFDTFYLTANLFYSGSLHWAQQQKIVNWAKEWLMLHIQDMPNLEKCRVEFTYRHPTDTFDLDNKVYFWCKLLLDIMKTPTSAQIIKAAEYGNEIKTINVLKDDSVRYVNNINMKYERGAPAIVLRITGRVEDTQQSLF